MRLEYKRVRVSASSRARERERERERIKDSVKEKCCIIKKYPIEYLIRRKRFL